MLRRHAPLLLILSAAVLTMAWAYALGSDTIMAISANVWGVAVLLFVFDITPRDSKEKREQR